MSRVAIIEIDAVIHTRCACPTDGALHVGDTCVVSADGIMEIGRVVSVEEPGGRAEGEKPGKLVRRATLQDLARADENDLMTKMAQDAAIAKIRHLGLAMRLVRVRYAFDRSRLLILFAAEERVDFRQLIRELAGELRTRVEMKQIGVRDESAIIGGMGPCGRHLCCCSWLKRFESINVKMAKVQRLALNPGSISGMCGRLRCCLHYEVNAYRELGRDVPKEGTVVECPDGAGTVVDRDILGQRVTVRLSDARIAVHPVSRLRAPGRKPEQDEE